VTHRTSTIELLTTPFLDTDLSKAIPEADLELKKRGWPKWAVSFVRFLLSFSLWTNAITWEEWSLGWFDVFAGYALTSFLLGILCLLFSKVFGVFLFKTGIVLLAYVGLFLIFVGLLLWLRSKENR